MIIFNRGRRKCFGIHLAYAELYLAVAAIWGHWRSSGEGGIRESDNLGVMALFETGKRDIEIESDFFTPMPQKGLKGIRVQVQS
jgi:hypothetical protein